MKQFWVHYKHNGERAACRVQAADDEQAKHNGLSLARHYYPDEQIEFVELERID